MHRLLVETTELLSSSPTLSKEAQNHLRVLRPKEGECVELFDGCGGLRMTTYDAAGRCLKPIELARSIARPPALTLFACVTKGSRWDWTIEKATELGVTRIVPVMSARTIVKVASGEADGKRERWTKIAEEAARQSDAAWVPEIVKPVSFADALRLVEETTCFVGALTNPPPKTIGEELAARRELAEPAIFVGPEGDFTPEELDALIARAIPVSFGSTILRAETAAIYGISCLKAVLDGLHAR